MALPLVTVGMTGIGGVIVTWVTKTFVGRIVLAVLFGIMFVLYSAFIYFFFDALQNLHTNINTLLSALASNGTSATGVMAKVFGALTCSGVIAGINSVVGFILSALTFRIMYSLHKNILKAGSQLYILIAHAVK